MRIPDDLTDDERRALATTARYRSEEVDDPRAHVPVADRDRIRARWRQIADALHLDPWGDT